MPDDKTAPEEKSSLGMSDEDFLKINPDEFETPPVVEDGGEEDVELDSEDEELDDEDAGDTGDDDNETDDDSSEETEDEDTEQNESDDDLDDSSELEGDTRTEDGDDEGAEEESSSADSEDDKSDTEGDTPEKDAVDYKNEYERILAPFKANGRQMQVESVDEALTLMKMGANYAKKMMAIKPSLAIVKMLANNDLLDPAKINSLIDLSKKSPEAIAKLIKDSGIDPVEIDVSKADSYSAPDHTVSEEEINLDEAIDSIRGTETFERTMNVIGKEWDAQSKSIVVGSPDIVGVINTHIQNGIYDVVQGVLDKERALGKYTNVPDVEAYKQVILDMQAKGTLIDPKANQQAAGDVKKPPVKKKQKRDSEAVKKRKKAASSTKKSRSGGPKPNINYLDVPDDEFLEKFGRQ